MKQMIAFGAVGVAAVFLAGTAFMVLRGEDDPYASCRSSQVAGAILAVRSNWSTARAKP